jgi:DegV family protein with EDD domain
MARIRVVTDSTADMDEEKAARLGIRVVPLNVHFGGRSYQDKAEITIDEFYRKLKEEKSTPTTSQPSVGAFEQVYRELLKDADGIVSVHISSGISGTVNSATLAAESVGPQRISIVDSGFLSYSLGDVAMRAAEVAETGASLAECKAEAEALIPRLRLFAAIDTLEYLRRGGRVSRLQAVAGSLLSIKVIVHLVGGLIVPADRVRTRANLVKRTAELGLDLGPLEEVAVLHGDDPTPADQLEATLREARPGLPIKRGRTGAVIGTHTGPGVFGLHCRLAE